MSDFLIRKELSFGFLVKILTIWNNQLPSSVFPIFSNFIHPCTKFHVIKVLVFIYLMNKSEILKNISHRRMSKCILDISLLWKQVTLQQEKLTKFPEIKSVSQQLCMPWKSKLKKTWRPEKVQSVFILSPSDDFKGTGIKVYDDGQKSVYAVSSNHSAAYNGTVCSTSWSGELLRQTSERNSKIPNRVPRTCICQSILQTYNSAERR